MCTVRLLGDAFGGDRDPSTISKAGYRAYCGEGFVPR